MALYPAVGGVTQTGLDVAFDRFTLARFGSDINASWDEIRIGDTFADVAGIPEPSSSALLGLGGLALILRRRK